MRGGTHITAGVIVGYALATSAGLSPVEVLALGAVGGLCAMIPDIDHPQSAIRHKTGLLGDLAAFWMKHRGITHQPSFVRMSTENTGRFVLQVLKPS